MLTINQVRDGSKASNFLDWARFISALLVLLVHLFGREQIPGYQAVMVFFVLSGFFISSSVIKSIVNGTWSWKIYMTNRLTRLWIVLLPALILTAFWSQLQIKTFGTSAFPSTLNGSFSMKTLIENLFFLQGVVSPELYGYNGPLWSLSFEFWYYILFPIMLLTFFSKRAVTKIVYGIIFVLLAVILGKHIMTYYLIWLLGAALVVMKPSSLVQRYQKSCLRATTVMFLISLYALYKLFHVGRPLPDMTHIIPDFSVGICFAFLVYVIINAYAKNTLPASSHHWGKYFAGMSYTLYLVHYPLLNFFRGTGILNETHGLKKLILSGIVFVVILVYAWIVSRLTEVHTNRVKGWILRINCKSRAATLEKAVV